jgi:anthranilate/para-aminobenzoate synthase component II
MESRILLSGKNLVLGMCVTVSVVYNSGGTKTSQIKSIIHTSTNKELYESMQFMFSARKVVICTHNSLPSADTHSLQRHFAKKNI